MGDFWKWNDCGEPLKGDSVSGGVGFWEVALVSTVLF